MINLERYQITCNKSPQAVKNILSNHIEPRKWIRWTMGDKPFEGTFDEHSFNINRLVFRRGTFLPHFAGKISYETGQCVVDVLMYFPPLLIVTTILACFGFIAFFVATPAYNTLFPFWLPFVVLFVGMGINFFYLRSEAKKSKQLLDELFH